MQIKKRLKCLFNRHEMIDNGHYEDADGIEPFKCRVCGKRAVGLATDCGWIFFGKKRW